MDNKIVLTVIISALLTAGCFSKEPEKTGREGSLLPDFQIAVADSTKLYRTSSIPNGKSIVLFFYGPNCPYSRTQMEEIIENMNKLKLIQFVIFTTSSFEEMKNFNKDYKIDKYTNIISGIDSEGFFPEYFKVEGVPYLAIYGKDKRLNQTYLGNVSGKQIKDVAEH